MGMSHGMNSLLAGAKPSRPEVSVGPMEEALTLRRIVRRGDSLTTAMVVHTQQRMA